MQKHEGQIAVARIIQIRKLFPNANPNSKFDYVDQFKANLLKLVAFIKKQSNPTFSAEITKKLPDLQNQLRNMKSVAISQQQAAKKQQENQKKIQNQKKIEQVKKPQGPKPPGNGELQKLKNQMGDAIVRQKPNIKWEDVAGLEQAKKVIQQAVILPMKFPQVFVGQRTPWKGILLYGPPGTGKTFLAKACATQQKNGTFFSISASDLMSKYVGQSQKTLKALFQLARSQRPSIIFIDQIDSIAGQRSSQQNEVSRRVKTQFLIQMQGLGNQAHDVLVLGATNLPWALDPAVRRRFEKRIYIPLPDIKGRLAMFKIVIAKNSLNISAEQIGQLASMTQGYSGSDIAALSNDALMAPVRSLQKIKLWQQVFVNGQCLYAPCLGQQKGNAKYFNGSMLQLKKSGKNLLIQTKYQHFIAALKSSKPSVSNSDLTRYVDFTKTFGMDG